MNTPKPDALPGLAEFRQRIDALDDKIIALFIERIGIVAQVGEMKRHANPGQCPIRAGREAEMVRRIIEKFKDSKFSPLAAAAMWRVLIGASTSVEAALKLSVHATDQEPDLYWLAREYFGPTVGFTRQPHVKRVIGDVIDGKASVGIVPFPHNADAGYWWTNLIQHDRDMPKIFAHLPFVHDGAPAHNAPAALAIAHIRPEETGDDRSLLVFEAGPHVSQHKLQSAFAAAKLEARWISIATLIPSVRHHLVEIDGFVTQEHEGLKSCLAGLNDSITATSVLGAYARPVILNNEKEPGHAQRPVPEKV